MRTIVVANRGDGDDGFVGERLTELGSSLVRCWREEPADLREAEVGADLIVLLGSDWSVYEPRNAELVDAERALIDRARRRGVPVLGICFGGQMLASALGAAITRAEAPEIGWRSLESEDPLLCPNGPWFQYHFDRWHDEGEVRSFASNSLAPQAFTLGRTLALQFHPEVTPETVSRWLRAVPGEVEAAGGDIESIEAETSREAPSARARCHALVDTFLAEIATRPAEVGLG